MISIERIKIGAWTLIPEEQLLLDPNNSSIHVEPKTCQVLAKLASQPGSVFDRNRMIEEVWNDVIVSDNSLYRCIFQLRNHFAAHPNSGISIENVRGKGYRLCIESEGGAHLKLKRTADPAARIESRKVKQIAHQAGNFSTGLGSAISHNPIRLGLVMGFLCIVVLGVGLFNSPLSIPNKKALTSESTWAIEFFDELQDVPEIEPIVLGLEQEQTVAKTLSILRPEVTWNVDINK